MASVVNASNTGFGGILMSGDSSGQLQLQTANTTAVTIDTSQNVGIGTTSPNGKFESYANSGYSVIANSSAGSVAINPSSNAIVFGTTNVAAYATGNYDAATHVYKTSGTERMRIDSSGNVLIGGTSPVGSSRLLVKGSGSSSGTTNLYVQNSSSADILYMRDDGAINTGTTTSSPYNLTTASGANAVLGSDGFLRRSTSSLKYKTDVQDATHGLSEVMQLRPVTYKGKEDGDKLFGGLIAEEVDAIGLTEFVEYAADGSPDALSYGHMVSLLTKAIQEQQTIINDLKARIETLESK